MASGQMKRKVSPDLDVESYVASAHAINGVNRDLLGGMVRGVGRTSGTLVLAGWSDYAKHLVNVFGVDGRVLAVADDEKAGKGWSFRDVPVVGTDEAVALAPDHFVCTDVENRVRVLGKITNHPEYRNQEVHLFPSPHSNQGRFYEPWQHSEFYRGLQHRDGAEVPGSMLGQTAVQFLVECLRQTLALSGDVLEVGTGQGGSAWPMARLLADLGLTKRLVLLDFFEELPRKHSEAVMYSEEIRDWFSFYPPTEVYPGNVDQDPQPMLDGTWCFVHYDAGFNANRLARCFGRLQPGGIIVLDNYSNIAANPAKFDAWFEDRGCRVSTVPNSGQGWVVKRPVAAGGRGGQQAEQPEGSSRETDRQLMEANERARRLREQLDQSRRELEELQNSRAQQIAGGIKASIDKANRTLRRGS